MRSPSHREAAAPAGDPLPADYRQMLITHVVEPWFPRSIDREYGGFRVEFDNRWKPRASRTKLLETQARQTLAAAELSIAFPQMPALSEAVAAGFSFLAGALWDHEHGGWYWCTDRAGKPLRADTKHLHGMAYAVSACFGVFAATGDRAALELGREGFRWIDSHAHDARHGGYFELLRRDGSVIDASDADSPGRDHIGTPVGQKDMNVVSDLLEVCAYGCAIAPDPLLRLRFDEILDLTLRHFCAAETPWFFFHRDWTHASTYWRPSNLVQTASRLFEARALVADPATLDSAAFKLIDYAFANGWDATRRGLLMDCHAGQPPTRRQIRTINWWTQIEGLKALEYALFLAPGHAGRRALKSALAQSLADNFIDRKHAGLYELSRALLRPIDRILPTRRRAMSLRKGSLWKDCNHEARMLLRLASPLDLTLRRGGLPWPAKHRAVNADDVP